MNGNDGTQDPLVARDMRVEDGWIDYNGHLNMAYYLVLFDRAVDVLIEAVGLLEDERIGPALYAVEAKVRYLAEVAPGSVLSCRTRVLSVDDNRLLSWQELMLADGRVAATCETLHLHMMRAPDGAAVAPFRPDIRARLAELVTDDAWPEGAARPVGARMAQ